MTFEKPKSDYWERKLVAYMHDPIDKVLRIQGHEGRAALLLEKYGLDAPNNSFWKRADGIASGFERGQVPSYSQDENKNGAVDFLEEPILTHPISKDCKMTVKLPDSFQNQSSADVAGKVNSELQKVLEASIGMKPGDSGYWDEFKGDPVRLATARFLYTHLALRFKLAEDNVAELGALWHRLPADTRFPDHSIWQHNALTSALYSSMELAGDENGVGLMAFSITPVQPFIATARKLRDFWTGSTILSWLAFEGIRWVMENLGPDHILYPSLIDQPLVNEYLEKVWKIPRINSWNKARDVASFPNKFLVLVPFANSTEIAAGITGHLNEVWQELSGMVLKKLSDVVGPLGDGEKKTIQSLFERQCGSFWDFNWASTRLVGKGDYDDITKLIPETLWKSSSKVCQLFNKIIEKKEYEDTCTGTLYGVSHSLVQSALAATKLKRQVHRIPEPGEKCHLCGEFEVLHSVPFKEGMPAADYKSKIDSFWKSLRSKWGREADFKKDGNEKLCTLCLVKRALYRCFEGKENKNHLLYTTFNHNRDGFPSTTEIALHGFFTRHGIVGPLKGDLAQRLFGSEEESGSLDGKKLSDRDKYYAILLMDGDKMGKLVNGETLASTWESILHPRMVSRLKDPGFNSVYRENWKEIFAKYPRRLLTPAIHAAISESLGDFALYGVSGIVEKYSGKLIYAGGDDVCAIMPVDTVYSASREIREFYHTHFRLIDDSGEHDLGSGEWKPAKGKLSIGLGTGSDISISAAILLCHHKENMGQMVSRTHHLLENVAKDELGRDSLIVELKKRSGGSRYFGSKWDDESWKAFIGLGKAISKESKKSGEGISTSLAYRIDMFRNGIDAIINSNRENSRELLIDFFKAQLERSSLPSGEGMAQGMADIILTNTGIDTGYSERLIVAAFLGSGEAL